MRHYLEDAARDVRNAVRVIRREATTSAAILLTIALGLGATTAILSVVRAALLQPLPYENAGRLVRVWEQSVESGERERTSFRTLLDWREGTRAFVGLEAVDGANITAQIGDAAEMIRAWRVTPGFFALLGVEPVRGRTWVDSDDDGLEDQVVVSQSLAARMGGEESALGSTLVLDRTPRTVIGVLPRSFHFGDDADVWIPLVPGDPGDRATRALGVIGRLRDDFDLSSARSDLARVTSALAAEHPDQMAGRTVALSPLRETLLGDVKPILLSLLAAVAVLLVITAANLGALMLVRNLNRRDELALRTALGASRGRLVRQLFVEGLVLAIAGAALSFYLGQVGVGVMMRAVPENLKPGMPYLADVGVDLATVAAVLAIAIVLATSFALGPAFRAIRAVAPLGHGERWTTRREDRRLRRILVAAQLGLTVVLLIGTAQLAGSFRKLVGREIGVAAPDQLVTMSISLAGPAYEEVAAQQRFYEQVVAQAADLPGVLGATAVNELPVGGSGMTTYEMTDEPTPVGQRPRVAMRMFAGDYFRTLGVPLREGRVVGSQDRIDTPRAIVISESLAARVGAGDPVLGRRIRLTRTGDTEWEIVGVVQDVHMGTLDAEPPPTVYVSHLQAGDNRLPLVVRTSSPPSDVAASLRELVRGIDPTVPVESIGTIGEQMRRSRAVFVRRFPLTIGAVFASTALLLAIVGLYSLCAREVLSRRREFSIRQVLGATPASVRAMMLRDGLALALLGVCSGVLAALPASQLLRSLLFGVRAVDPYVYGGVGMGVLAVALLATALAAWRGSASNLQAALRSD